MRSIAQNQRETAIERPGQRMLSMPMYRCSFCEHANPLAAKFCNECGSPLNLKPCPQCDSVNGATSKACYMCGAFFPLRGSDPEAAPASARATLDSYTAAGPYVSPDRRPGAAGVMATVLPAIVLGAIAIAAYFVGYVQPGPVRDWLNGAWATSGSNRDVVATTAMPAATSVPPSIAPPNPVSVPTPSDAGSTSPTLPPMQAITPVTAPPHVATAGSATPAGTAQHSEKKSSAGTKKPVKKPKTTTKKPAPAQANATR